MASLEVLCSMELISLVRWSGEGSGRGLLYKYYLVVRHIERKYEYWRPESWKYENVYAAVNFALLVICP